MPQLSANAQRSQGHAQELADQRNQTGDDKYRGIPEQYIKRPEERACNPVLQAKVLNRAQTGLNVTLGLCVGHDSLFYRFSQAPVTTLFAKERVRGHSRAPPLYLTHSFSGRRLEPEK